MQEYKSDRAIRTRDALVSAAFDLMLERPLEDIPIDDLVAAAGSAKAASSITSVTKMASNKRLPCKSEVKLKSKSQRRIHS